MSNLSTPSANASVKDDADADPDNDIDNFFHVAFQNFSLTSATLVIAVILSAIAFVLISSIVWFELNHVQSKHAFLNKLFCSAHISALEYLILVHSCSMIRFLTDPFPEVLCFVLQIFRRSIILQVLMFFNFLVSARYVFIFKLKNPWAFKDDFWWMFANIWTVGFSTIIQFSWSMMPGRQTFEYYFCTGEDPAEAFQLPAKPLGHFELVSVLLAICAQCRILYFKKMSHYSDRSHSNQVSVKTIVIQELENYPITNFVNIIGGLVAVGSGPLFAAFITSKPWKESATFPNNLVIYYWILVSPGLVGVFLALMYYVRNYDTWKLFIKQTKSYFNKDSLDA